MANGQKQSEIKPRMNVGIVLKEDQSTGYITYGVVQQLLTRSSTYPHGIKVRLTTREVGRIKEIVK